MGSKKFISVSGQTVARLVCVGAFALGLQACSSTSSTLTSAYGSRLSTDELRSRATSDTAAAVMLSRRLHESRAEGGVIKNFKPLFTVFVIFREHHKALVYE